LRLDAWLSNTSKIKINSSSIVKDIRISSRKQIETSNGGTLKLEDSRTMSEGTVGIGYSNRVEVQDADAMIRDGGRVIVGTKPVFDRLLEISKTAFRHSD